MYDPTAEIFRTCDEFAAGRTLIRFPPESPLPVIDILTHGCRDPYGLCLHFKYPNVKKKRKKLSSVHLKISESLS